MSFAAIVSHHNYHCQIYLMSSTSSAGTTLQHSLTPFHSALLRPNLISHTSHSHLLTIKSGLIALCSRLFYILTHLQQSFPLSTLWQEEHAWIGSITIQHWCVISQCCPSGDCTVMRAVRLHSVREQPERKKKA